MLHHLGGSIPLQALELHSGFDQAKEAAVWTWVRCVFTFHPEKEPSDCCVLILSRFFFFFE